MPALNKPVCLRLFNMHLLATRRFLPLFITQFLGAFNDNLFKNALVMLVAYKAAYEPAQIQFLVTLAAALFILPYFLFSATAGQLADKFDRARIARITKLWEIIIVAVGAVGFLGHHAEFLLFVLFGLGAQSTFFGPVKYALLPQHLRDDELVAGNAYIEAGTFLAILLGTITGGVLIMRESGEVLVVGVSVAVALVGYASSWFIPKAPAPMPALKVGWNIARESWRMVAHDRKNKRVFHCILGISWFWLVGATFLSQFPVFAKELLRADETVVTLLLAVFSVGIGLGSFLSSWLARGEISSKFVPMACFGMSVFMWDLFWVSSGLPAHSAAELIGAGEFMIHFAHIRIIADLFLIAVCGGVFIVPLYAIMQHDSAPETRARTIATNNIINAFFMVVSAVVVVVLLQMLNLSLAQLWLVMAITNFAVAIWVRRVRGRYSSA